jgi:hypothetical protein
MLEVRQSQDLNLHHLRLSNVLQASTYKSNSLIRTLLFLGGLQGEAQLRILPTCATLSLDDFLLHQPKPAGFSKLEQE